MVGGSNPRPGQKFGSRFLLHLGSLAWTLSGVAPIQTGSGGEGSHPIKPSRNEQGKAVAVEKIVLLHSHTHPHIPTHTQRHTRELHWLPVADRVQFKIATLVWKATTGSAPDYIAELCLPVGTQTGRRALRSASRNDLMMPSFPTTTCARRDFSIAAPRIWRCSSAVCACCTQLYSFL